MDTYFYCSLCSKEYESNDCVLIDIADGFYGRSYLFKCPSCRTVQSSYIVKDFLRKNANTSTQKKRTRVSVHAKMHDDVIR